MGRSTLASLFIVAAIAVGCGGSTFTAASDAGGGGDATTGDGGVSGDGAVTGDGGVTTDGATGDGGLDLEGGVGSCSGSPSIFGNIIKGCTVVGGCVVVFHQIDCCGSMAAVGINHASRDAFTADEMAWVATCPGCGCAARPTVGEDGKTSTNMSDFKVACVNNECRSYIP